MDQEKEGLISQLKRDRPRVWSDEHMRRQEKDKARSTKIGGGCRKVSLRLRMRLAMLLW
jgi:hypothetical protein